MSVPESTKLSPDVIRLISEVSAEFGNRITPRFTTARRMLMDDAIRNNDTSAYNRVVKTGIEIDKAASPEKWYLTKVLNEATKRARKDLNVPTNTDEWVAMAGEESWVSWILGKMTSIVPGLWKLS